jgi:hypothetical protein
MLLKTLAQLSPEKKRDALTRLVTKAQGPANGQLAPARLEIRTLEDKYGMTTAEMKAAFRSGRLKENYEVVRWLMLAGMVRESA